MGSRASATRLSPAGIIHTARRSVATSAQATRRAPWLRARASASDWVGGTNCTLNKIRVPPVVGSS